MIVAGAAVAAAGTGPPVLLSSGLGGAAFDWAQVVDRLPGCRTLAFDRPGLGGGPPSPAAPSLRREVALLAALARFAGAPVVVVAHSVAAFHAEAFARVHPGLVRGLVLVDPSCEPDPGRRWHAAAVLDGPVRGLGAVLEATGLARALGPWARDGIVAASSVRGDGPTPRRLIESVYGRGGVLATVLAENLAYPEMAADLAALRVRLPFPAVPVEVLTALGDVGPGDPWRERHAALAALGSPGRQIVLPRARHLVQLDDPGAVSAAVLRVVSGA